LNFLLPLGELILPVGLDLAVVPASGNIYISVLGRLSLFQIRYFPLALGLS